MTMCGKRRMDYVKKAESIKEISKEIIDLAAGLTLGNPERIEISIQNKIKSMESLLENREEVI